MGEEELCGVAYKWLLWLEEHLGRVVEGGHEGGLGEALGPVQPGVWSCFQR